MEARSELEFPEVARPLREKLEAVADVRHFAKGTVIYEEGFPCPLVPMLLSGVVRVFKMGETGREITLYRVEPGQICVLSSTCALSDRDAKLPAVAEAETDVTLLAVPVHIFRKLMKTSPELQGYLNEMLTERLAEMMMVVDEVAFGRVDLRLAELLARGARKDSQAMIETTHAQLAVELGSAREVVSRVLKDFERRGFVRLGRGKIEVTDPEGMLEKLSGRAM